MAVVFNFSDWYGGSCLVLFSGFGFRFGLGFGFAVSFGSVGFEKIWSGGPSLFLGLLLVAKLWLWSDICSGCVLIL